MEARIDSKTNVFEQAGVKFEVSPTDILASLDALDKLSSDQFKALATANGVPSDPYDKRLLKPILMGIVQNAWYLAYKGQVPEKCVANQDRRVARYKEQLEELKNHNGEDAVVSRKAPSAAPARERVVNLYRLTTATKETWEKFKGQKRLIVRAFLELKAVQPEGTGVSVKTISETVKETEETVAPSLKNCAFHVNAFVHEGIVECTNAGEASPEIKPQAPAPKPAAEKPAAAAPKAEQQKNSSKKEAPKSKK